jgi:hypothetical protein
LNTNDIFLLNTSEKQYIWTGANANKFLVIPEATLVDLGSVIKVRIPLLFSSFSFLLSPFVSLITVQASREQVFIKEGEEPADFWENVGEAKYLLYIFIVLFYLFIF